MKTLAYLLLFALFYTSHQQAFRFYVVRQWKYVNFTWPDEDALTTATSTGTYVPENNIIAGVKYFEDYFYVTLPRMKPGVPATLARIRAGPGRGASPALQPYPSWEMNAAGDCNNLQNVQNVEVDAKGQLWIIDGGKVHTLVNPVVKCPPKLVIYDIAADKVNMVYQFPEEVAPKNGSYLYDLVVDDTDGGYAYITDNSASDPGIIVFCVKENRSWKIRSPRTMTADSSALHFNVNGISINTPINIAGIALGPKIHTSNDRVVINEDREVYFCPLSSRNLYSINTSVLTNERLAQTGSNHDSAVKDVGLKTSQTVGMIMDNQGILYYGLLGDNAVARWDSHTPFRSGQRLIARDPKYLEWPNSFTFDAGGNLTVLINSMDRFIFDKIDLNEYNFRLISSHVGGKSYVYSDHFDYESRDGSTEPGASPEPSPTPEAQSRSHDHEHGHDHRHDHDRAGGDVKITAASGSAVAITILSLLLNIFVILA